MVAWTTTSQPLIGSNSQEYVPKKGFHKWTEFLLAVGSFLLAVELFYFQLTILAFLLLLGLFCLQFELLCLHLELFWLTMGKCV